MRPIRSQDIKSRNLSIMIISSSLAIGEKINMSLQGTQNDYLGFRDNFTTCFYLCAVSFVQLPFPQLLFFFILHLVLSKYR